MAELLGNIGELTAGFSGIFHGIWLFVVFILIFGVGAAAMYAIWKAMQWKYKVYILEELSDGGTRIYTAKGKIQKRQDKTQVFRINIFKGANLDIPPLNSIMVGQRGEKCVFLKKFGMGDFDYVPLGIYLKGLQVDLVPFSQGRKNWSSVEMKRSNNKYGSFWDKYGGAILNFMTIMFAMIAIIFIMKMMGDISHSLEAVGNSIKTGLTALGEQGGGVIEGAKPPF